VTFVNNQLIHRTPGGKLNTWSIVVVGNRYHTITGEYNRDVGRQSAYTVCFAKNVGASNERSAEQVAIDTATSKYKAKLDEGYVETIEEIEAQDRVPRAMLAKPKLDKEMTRVAAAALLGQCLVQPKLDGFRCLADRFGLWTRNLRKIETCRHVEEALKPVFEKYPDLVIDGELYNHNLRSDFGKIQSLLTKQRVGLFDALETEDIIQYHVYDFVEKSSFTDRFVGNIQKVSGVDFVKIVETIRVWDVDSIYRKHKKFIEKGYEGTMVRVSAKGYEGKKRASQLIKLKDFSDEEFTILDVKEGKGQWSGYAKSITCAMKNSEDTFDAGCSGSQPQLRVLLERSEEYIGGTATVQFFDKFPSGKPRFPVATKYFTW